MAIYYFDSREGDRITPDECGAECASLQLAEALAQRIVCEYGWDLPPEGGDRQYSVAVHDGLRQHVSTVSLTLRVLRQAPVAVLRRGPVGGDREPGEQPA